jgi:hypothetical protein
MAEATSVLILFFAIPFSLDITDGFGRRTFHLDSHRTPQKEMQN